MGSSLQQAWGRESSTTGWILRWRCSVVGAELQIIACLRLANLPLVLYSADPSELIEIESQEAYAEGEEEGEEDGLNAEAGSSSSKQTRVRTIFQVSPFLPPADCNTRSKRDQFIGKWAINLIGESARALTSFWSLTRKQIGRLWGSRITWKQDADVPGEDESWPCPMKKDPSAYQDGIQTPAAPPPARPATALQHGPRSPSVGGSVPPSYIPIAAPVLTIQSHRSAGNSTTEEGDYFAGDTVTVEDVDRLFASLGLGNTPPVSQQRSGRGFQPTPTKFKAIDRNSKEMGQLHVSHFGTPTVPPGQRGTLDSVGNP